MWIIVVQAQSPVEPHDKHFKNIFKYNNTFCSKKHIMINFEEILMCYLRLSSNAPPPLPSAAGFFGAQVPRRETNGGNLQASAAPEWQPGVSIWRCGALGQLQPPHGCTGYGLGTVPARLRARRLSAALRHSWTLNIILSFATPSPHGLQNGYTRRSACMTHLGAPPPLRHTW